MAYNTGVPRAVEYFSKNTFKCYCNMKLLLLQSSIIRLSIEWDLLNREQLELVWGQAIRLIDYIQLKLSITREICYRHGRWWMTLKRLRKDPQGAMERRQSIVEYYTWWSEVNEEDIYSTGINSRAGHKRGQKSLPWNLHSWKRKAVQINK